MLAKRNLYAELHLQPSASASEIRTAYRRAALSAHPDKGGSTAAFHVISVAFEVLSCPASRALYDRIHKRTQKIPNRCRASSGCVRAKAPNVVRIAGSNKRKQVPASMRPEAKAPRLGKCDDDESSLDSCEGGVEGGVGPPGATKAADHTHTSLDQLRFILKDLSPLQRRAAITNMPPCVRAELLTYMTYQHPSPTVIPGPTGSKKSLQKKCGNWSRGTDVRSVRHVHKISYKAQLRLQHLRMYTRAHTDLDTAISYQMALILARHAIHAAGQEVWNSPHEFVKVFTAALCSSGTSQDELGLSVFIFMRADEWISRCATITSPVMNLVDAVAVHSQLLAARQTSWPQLRNLWVKLMLQTQRRRQLSLVEAETIADKARLALMQRRLKHAVAAAERAINLRFDLAKKVKRAEAKLQRDAAMKKKAAEKLLERKRRELLAARRRWYRTVDLTMEEILQGPPQEA